MVMPQLLCGSVVICAHGNRLFKETSSCDFHEKKAWDNGLRRCLHGLLLVTACGGGEVSDVNIVILLQLLQAWQNSLLNEILALGRRGDSLARLLDLNQGLIGRETAQGVDENGVGLGDVEADIGDFVRDKSVQDGNDGAFDNIKSNNRGKSLWSS